MYGDIGRHSGKQMNKETKLRIHNITAKAVNEPPPCSPEGPLRRDLPFIRTLFTYLSNSSQKVP